MLNPKPIVGYLVIRNHPTLKDKLPIYEGENIIGRVPQKSNIVVKDGQVSSVHAKLKISNNKIILIDIGSKNGTFVNLDTKERLEKGVQTQLEDGQSFALGEVQCFVQKIQQVRKSTVSPQIRKKSPQKKPNLLFELEESSEIYIKGKDKKVQEDDTNKSSNLFGQKGLKMGTQNIKQQKIIRIKKESVKMRRSEESEISQSEPLDIPLKQEKFKDKQQKQSKDKISKQVKQKEKKKQQPSKKQKQEMQKKDKELKKKQQVEKIQRQKERQQRKRLMEEQQKEEKEAQRRLQEENKKKLQEKKNKQKMKRKSEEAKAAIQQAKKKRGRKANISSKDEQQKKSKSKQKSQTSLDSKKTEKQSKQKQDKKKVQKRKDNEKRQSKEQKDERKSTKDKKQMKKGSKKVLEVEIKPERIKSKQKQKKDKSKQKKEGQTKTRKRVPPASRGNSEEDDKRVYRTRQRFLKVTKFMVSGNQINFSVNPELKLVQDEDEDYDCLVMESFIRTFKLLFSIVRGIPIVRKDWLVDSEYYKKVADFDKYWLAHPEDKNLIKQSVLKAQSGFKVLNDMKFYIACDDEKLHLPFVKLQRLIYAAGGEVIRSAKSIRGNKSLTKEIIILLDEKYDENQLASAKQLNKDNIYLVELVLQGCLTQQLEMKTYKISA